MRVQERLVSRAMPTVLIKNWPAKTNKKRKTGTVRNKDRPAKTDTRKEIYNSHINVNVGPKVLTQSSHKVQIGAWYITTHNLHSKQCHLRI